MEYVVGIRSGKIRRGGDERLALRYMNKVHTTEQDVNEILCHWVEKPI
jgi:hypothetical protein